MTSLRVVRQNRITLSLLELRVQQREEVEVAAQQNEPEELEHYETRQPASMIAQEEVVPQASAWV